MIRNFYISTINGERKGIISFFFKIALLFLSIAYFVGYKIRAGLYKIGVFRTFTLPCPVISVGNITAGGTGKTPLVMWLAKWLANRNFKVAILARGYGKLPDSDDEDLITTSENIIRLTGKNRVALANRAIDEYGAEIIILDDGFGHLKIKRDLDIVLVDSTIPFSNGFLLPRGFLREEPSSLKRADIIALTRADQVTPECLSFLYARVAELAPAKPIVQARHKPLCVKRAFSTHEVHDYEMIKGAQVYAFCGIGNADAFRLTLQSIGANVVRFRKFPDHYRFTKLDAIRMVAEAQEFMVDFVITTEKDAMRLATLRNEFEMPVYILKVEFEFIKGIEIIDGLLENITSKLTKEKTVNKY